MIFSLGFMIFLSFWVIFLRLPITTRLRWMAWPFALDITVTVMFMIVFAGTGFGLMSAVFAGLLISASISFYRKRYGYIRSNKYHVGRVNRIDDIKAVLTNR